MRFRYGLGLFAGLVLCVAACHEKQDQPAPSAPASGASAEKSPPRARGSAAPVTSLARAAPSASVPAPGGSASPLASADTKKNQGAAAKDPGGPEVKLLSPGAAPRRELRYRFKKGHVEKVKLTSGTRMSVRVSGKAMPAPAMPTVEMTAVIKVLSVAADGTAKRELVLRDVQLADEKKVPEAVRQSVESQLSDLSRLKGHDSVDTRGRLRSAELDTSALTNPQVKQLMQSMQSAFGQLSAPFPEQAVGKGARWQITTNVEQMGMKLNQVATYTLEKLEGDRGTTRVELKQSAPGSHIQIPGVPMGVKSDLLGMSGTGKGNVDFDLSRSIPGGDITTQSNVKVRTSAAGRTEDTQMDMTLTETFKPL